VTVTLGEGGDAEIQRWATALVRAATKDAAKAGVPPPRKIARWTG
jgi:hypothetical protein